MRNDEIILKKMTIETCIYVQITLRGITAVLEKELQRDSVLLNGRTLIKQGSLA